MYHKIIISV